MNHEALRQLARVVEKAPGDLFCMNTFEAELPCGTVRCAAGWAAQDAWFQDTMPALTHLKSAVRIGILAQWLGELFGITEKDANNLFGLELDARPYNPSDPTHIQMRRDVSKLEVLANIRRLLRGAPTKPYKATQL